MLKNNKGFTLVELAAIIMILVILATIAIPTFSKFLSNTSDERNQEMGQDIFIRLKSYIVVLTKTDPEDLMLTR